MRLIDADALIQVLCVNMDTGHQFDRATHCVDEMPTVDAVPVKRGQWRKTYLDHEAFGERPSIFYCSACCACSNVKTDYCPNCGARMDEE